MRTTLTLPDDVLERVDDVVRAGKARSRNEFVATALRRELALVERAVIDAAFAAMATDAEAQADAQRIDAQFAKAGGEALREAER